MRCYLSIFAVFLAMTSPLAYADLEDRLNSRWRGAWVIVNGELYSNCDSTYTDNRVSGDLIRGNGRVAMPTGELAKVRRIDVKRRRVDVFLDLKENVLIEYQEGPFTLYREASCRIELLVDTAGRRTKNLTVDNIEAQFTRLFERYARLAEVEHSPNWNRRARQAYPEDYEQTLAEYHVWQAEKHNRLVEQRIDDAIEQASQLLVTVSQDKNFGAGLGYGLAAMKENIGGDCDRLLASNPGTYEKFYDAPNPTWANGYETGQHLGYYVELTRRLRGCFMPPVN
jgi:hypothetical protein